MTVRRVVVDTNILISAALHTGGLPRTVVDILKDSDIRLLFCEETLEEQSSRLRRPKFARYWDEGELEAYLGEVEAAAEWVAISGKPMGCRDRDDDKFLETAIEGGADCLVTGDRDLLEMSPFMGFPILSPSDFLAHWNEACPQD